VEQYEHVVCLFSVFNTSMVFQTLEGHGTCFVDNDCLICGKRPLMGSRMAGLPIRSVFGCRLA
jgi:hypothetical protein